MCCLIKDVDEIQSKLYSEDKGVDEKLDVLSSLLKIKVWIEY